MGCCNKLFTFVSKYLVVLCNFAIACGGVAILVGALAYSGDFYGTLNHFGFHLNHKLVLSVGAISVLIGLLGVLAAFKYRSGFSKLYLIIFALVLLALIGVELTVGATTAVYVGALDNVAARNNATAESLTKYEQQLDDSMNKIYKKCCDNADVDNENDKVCTAISEFLDEDTLECAGYENFKLDIKERVHEILPPMTKTLIGIGSLQLLGLFAACFLTCCGAKKEEGVALSTYHRYDNATPTKKTTGNGVAGTAGAAVSYV